MPRLLAIEWNDVEARLAVASRHGDQVVIEHAFAVPVRATTLADGQTAPDVVGSLAGVLAERGIGRLDTLVSVGRSNIELRQVSVPPAPDDEMPDLVRFQSMKEFTGLQEDWPLDFVAIDEAADQGRRVLAAAMDPAVARQIQQTCQAAGLKLRRMLLRPCAAASLLQRRAGAQVSQVRLLVDLLGDEADLTVMIGAKVVFLRTTRLPGDPLSEPGAAQALVGEMRRTVAAAQNQLDSRRVEGIVLCGAGPQHVALAKSFAHHMEVPAEVFDPFAGLKIEGDLKRGLPDHPGRFAPLLGMLWDELTGTSHAIDFLHPRRRREPISQRRIYVRAGLAATIVLLLGVSVIWVKTDNLDAEIQQLERQSQEYDSQLTAITKTEQTVAEMEKWQAGEVVWLEELRWLSDKFPTAQDAMLTQFQGSAGQKGTEAALEGVARSVDTVNSLEQSLCDKRHRVVGKDKTEDATQRPYTIRFRSSLNISAEGR